MAANFTVFAADDGVVHLEQEFRKGDIIKRVSNIPRDGLPEGMDWIVGDFDDASFRIEFPEDPAGAPYAVAKPQPQDELVRMIVRERRRRFTLGFDYSFGESDPRGSLHFGTTREDMEGWDDVSQISQALLNVGMPEAEIAIETDTAPAVVTALEWQQILISAGQWKQAIWLRSFDLQKLDPIPQDIVSNPDWWDAPLPAPGS